MKKVEKGAANSAINFLVLKGPEYSVKINSYGQGRCSVTNARSFIHSSSPRDDALIPQSCQGELGAAPFLGPFSAPKHCGLFLLLLAKVFK